MIITNLTQVGNPIIRAEAKEVINPKTKAVQKIVTDLVDSMRHYGLVGLAAPQIGKNVRVYVSEIRQTKIRRDITPDPLRVFINPRILSYSKKMELGWEGCGSVASSDLFAKVKRPSAVVVEATDEHGNQFKLKARGLLARVIQHEQDHLDGIVFTDKADTSTYMSKVEYLKLRKSEAKKLQ
ncbi:MAG: hypothetical protein RLZZ70_387 [Candidatus Parcubacteria bacterium]|jgi:peptide deformylase